MAINSKQNEYNNLINRELFRKCPKTVIGAILTSYLLLNGVSEKDISKEILNEWETLHQNCTIPQKAPKINL